MKIEHYQQTELQPAEGCEGVGVRWVISKEDSAPHFAMRIFDVLPGASTPYHQHPWEHEVFILQGEGAVKTEEGERPFAAEYVIYIAPNELHQFLNKGKDILRFICLVPHVES